MARDYETSPARSETMDRCAVIGIMLRRLSPAKDQLSAQAPDAHAELCGMTGLPAAGGPLLFLITKEHGLQREQVRPTEPVSRPGSSGGSV
ncbi:hypothetical protein GCM10022403_017830 [Streptomyces coacervatus]|uniref:Uncharacterized protein n=1 Tax=Streptomyces coacervatus TaxID=647381 RepID=A0ABP7H8U7_9ACTN